MEKEDDKEDCPICYQPITLPYKLGCGHCFCFLCLKRAYEDKKECPYCRGVISEDIYNTSLKREEIEKDKEEEGTAWYYLGAQGQGLWLYDPESSKELEEHYQKYLVNKEDKGFNSFDLFIMNRCYKIDFDNMTQAYNRKKRDILRVDKDMNIYNNLSSTNPSTSLIVKGIAGIKYV